MTAKDLKKQWQEDESILSYESFLEHKYITLHAKYAKAFNSQNSSQAACICPVCSGNGLVPNGFYAKVGTNQWASSSTTPEQCRSCRGKGFVIADASTDKL